MGNGPGCNNRELPVGGEKGQDSWSGVTAPGAGYLFVHHNESQGLSTRRKREEKTNPHILVS